VLYTKLTYHYTSTNAPLEQLRYTQSINIFESSTYTVVDSGELELVPCYQFEVGEEETATTVGTMSVTAGGALLLPVSPTSSVPLLF